MAERTRFINRLRLGLWNRNIIYAIKDILGDRYDWGVLPDGESEIRISTSREDGDARALFGQWLRTVFESQLKTGKHKWKRDGDFIFSDRIDDNYSPVDFLYVTGQFSKKLYAGRIFYRVRPEWIFAACDYLEGKEIKPEYQHVVIGVPLDPIKQFLEQQKNKKLADLDGKNFNDDSRKKIFEIEEEFFNKYKMGYIME